ncbi:CapA family protein [Leucobacter albus]|uniref:CapA family protein n=1 Tax=Leucobacter albus TaxID=272210 RepID=A0ABW3TLQ8_9MICO
MPRVVVSAPLSASQPPKSPDSPPKLAWIDTAKGLLIVLVVLWHVVMKTYLEIDWRVGLPIPGVWGFVNDFAYPVRMPVFFVVSGLLAANAVARPWHAVLRGRVIRFVYLYLLWSLIHMVTMWAFPDFPTLVPRSLAEFVEAVTISPPNTWYLYALALYFVIVKLLRRLPGWLVLVLAALPAIAVAAGLVDVVSNRGSLISNLVFFVVGVQFAAQIKGVGARRRPIIALTAVLAYTACFAAMRLAHAEAVPGVWLFVSLVGVGAGLALAPVLAGIDRVGPALGWLGTRTLAVYVIHMPLLALVDSVLVEPLSESRIAVQLVAAVALPIVLTGIIVIASVWLGELCTRDGLTWLFDLPRGHRASRDARSAGGHGRISYRTPVAVAIMILIGVGGAGATAVPSAVSDPPRYAAARPGEVSIGAVGDMLLYSAEQGVPAGGGSAYFDGVRHWFSDDLVTGNLEQAITADTGHGKCGTHADCFAFRSDPAAAQLFNGFDVLNLANNHSRDFGQAGYDNTRAALAAAGVRTVGDRNEISYSAIGDTVVALVGFAPYDGFNRPTNLRHVKKVVRAAAEWADIVVVQAHIGAEGKGADVVRPGIEMMYGENRGDPVAFAHAAVDAGADLVLGHGPHVLRGLEFYRGRLIAYSLGNFGGGGVFGRDPATRFGAYVSVRLRADGSFAGGEVRSVRFDYEGGTPVPDPGGEAAALMSERGQRDFGANAAVIDGAGSIAER